MYTLAETDVYHLYSAINNILEENKYQYNSTPFSWYTIPIIVANTASLFLLCDIFLLSVRNGLHSFEGVL